MHFHRVINYYIVLIVPKNTIIYYFNVFLFNFKFYKFSFTTPKKLN